MFFTLPALTARLLISHRYFIFSCPAPLSPPPNRHCTENKQKITEPQRSVYYRCRLFFCTPARTYNSECAFDTAQSVLALITKTNYTQQHVSIRNSKLNSNLTYNLNDIRVVGTRGCNLIADST